MIKKTDKKVVLADDFSPKNFWMASVVVMMVYFFSRLILLDHFPVFADESIYIRWAQLILDDWRQYLFFALNDGKTPLYIWMLSFFHGLSANQLVAGRLVSVMGGIVQVGLIGLILKQLGARRWTQVLGMFLVVILPFWVTYHRLALMDGWLTVWLSLALYFGLKLIEVQKSASKILHTQKILMIAGYGLSLGLSLWTKLPALFYLPICLWIPFYSWLTSTDKSKKNVFLDLVMYFVPHGIAVGIGCLFFVLLRVSPAFGQLFSRGQDFTFTVGEILGGKWTETLPNLMRFLGYFVTYMSFPVLLACMTGLFSARARSRVVLLLGGAILFVLPFAILGKVVHPRYLLPAVIFVTLAASLSAEAIWEKVVSIDHMIKKSVLSIVVALLFAHMISTSFYFMSSFILTPDMTPFAQHDRTQYLEEWSSGHGITESVDLIRSLTKDHTVAVATEGRFGTLPDGLLLYFYGQNVDNLYIEGIGQYPVKSLPPFFTDRAKTFDQSLLIVNSHRNELPLPESAKLAEFCRPNRAPCLQVWDITEQVQAAAAMQRFEDGQSQL